MSRLEDDDLLLALRTLDDDEPHADRSRAVLAQAPPTMARRRRFAEKRVVVLAGVYAATIAPFAAGSLSAGFLASAIAQALIVCRYARGAGVWP